MQKEHIISISEVNPCYPADFKRINPIVRHIYAIGNIDLLNAPHKLGVVGSRMPSSYGVDTTKLLTRKASQAGAVIVSGLALGIDSIAHQEAINQNGRTIAVLPSSILNPYPMSHTKLAHSIVKSGGLLISEYYDARPNKYCFVKRNRIIAALADVLLVPEATVESGSRHTVEFAHDLHKSIALVPGAINSPLSELPNNWIKQGGFLINTPSDLLALLKFNEKLIAQEFTIPRRENVEEQTLINLLAKQPVTTDSLLASSQFNINQFNVHLTMLEIRGIIERTANNQWRLAN